ncbi:hypothetical protein T440DRAFT_221589 [Plenodomus tracheiphilus IPT5]|uniref:Uncharacterized protein n=1 Tax=Plenodomus tracheiphilus IPT5 TaxID=1408161 RepID=A0A6A7AUB5_9PLEO|nr:hypothetical protein T440DRAFT_221589 [Plenodomus tracheiphilus IPT5]
MSRISSGKCSVNIYAAPTTSSTAVMLPPTMSTCLWPLLRSCRLGVVALVLRKSARLHHAFFCMYSNLVRSLTNEYLYIDRSRYNTAPIQGHHDRPDSPQSNYTLSQHSFRIIELS